MTVARRPSVWFEFYLEQYPSLVTLLFRWAKRPMADPGSWKEGRVFSFEEMFRALSSIAGDPEVSTTQLLVNDADNVLRTLLNGATTQFWTGREGNTRLLSEDGRASGNSDLARFLFRGRVTDMQERVGRGTTNKAVAISLTGLLGSEFSAYNFDKQIPQVLIGDEHVNIAVLPSTAENIGKPYQIYGGEHSDKGRVDVNGDSAEKGYCPVYDVGDVDFSDAVSPPPPIPVAPPVITASGAIGTIGEKLYYYAVTLKTQTGETPLSNIVAINGAISRNVSNYNFIVGTYDNGGVSPYNKVRVWRSEDGVNWTQWLDEASYYGAPGNFSYGDGASTITAPDGSGVDRNELDDPKDGTPVVVNTAFGSDSGWGRLVVAIGVYDVHAVFGSDLSTQGTPKRMKFTADMDGTEFLTSHSAGWPHPDPFIELTNSAGETIRMTVIYVRGERLTAHRERSVTIAVNLCGPDDVGDGSGNQLQKAFYLFQWFINEHVLKDGGKGYRSGNWGPLETFANGDAMIKTSAIEEMQERTQDWVGGDGYLAHFALLEPITLREFLRRWHITFTSFSGEDHFGQIKVVLPDYDADGTTGRLYRDSIEIVQLDDPIRRNDLVQTWIDYQYDWDPDANKFWSSDHIADLAMADAHKQTRKPGGDPKACYYTRDKTTADDAQARYLTLVKRAPRLLPFSTTTTGLEDDLGSQIRITHYAGGPDVRTPALVMRHAIKSVEPVRVHLTCLDLARLVASAMPLLQDETTMAGNLGDETSAADPPVGAFELR